MTPRIGMRFSRAGETFCVVRVAHSGSHIAVYFRQDVLEPNSGNFRVVGPERPALLKQMQDVQWLAAEVAA